MKNGIFKKVTCATAALLFVMAAAPFAFAQQSVRINVMDNSYSPRDTTIAVGTTVTWVNTGSMAHTVTFETENFDSGNLAPGLSTSHTFTTPGTYRYYCKYHGAPGGQGMSGTITVTGTASTSSASTSPETSASTSTNSTYDPASTDVEQNGYEYPPQNYAPYPPQQPTQNPQIPNTGGQPYVSLNSVPYTGFDLGPTGDAIYALLMSTFFLSLGYLTFYYARAFYFRGTRVDN